MFSLKAALEQQAILSDESRSPKEAKLTIYHTTETIPQIIEDLADEEDLDIERIPLDASNEASQQILNEIKSSIVDDLLKAEGDDEYNVHMRLIVVDPDRQGFFYRHLLETEGRPKVYAVPVSNSGDFGTTEIILPIDEVNLAASNEAVDYYLHDIESIKRELRIRKAVVRNRRTTVAK